MADDLNFLRDEIDEIDNELLALLDRRLELVKRVARLKAENRIPYFDPAREAVILAKEARLKGRAVGFMSTVLLLSRLELLLEINRCVGARAREKRTTE